MRKNRCSGTGSARESGICVLSGVLCGSGFESKTSVSMRELQARLAGKGFISLVMGYGTEYVLYRREDPNVRTRRVSSAHFRRSQLIPRILKACEFECHIARIDEGVRDHPKHGA